MRPGGSPFGRTKIRGTLNQPCTNSMPGPPGGGRSLIVILSGAVVLEERNLPTESDIAPLKRQCPQQVHAA